MLKETLIAFIPLLALCTCQSTGLDNTQQLAPDFRLDWTVQTASSDIIIQIQAKAVGWLFLSIDNGDKTLTDAFKGGYNNTNGRGYVVDMHATINPTTGAYGALVVDTNDLIMQSSFEYPPETVLRVKRSLNTGEPDDVAIVAGPMKVSWAYSDSDDINAPLKGGGTGTVTFF